MQIQIDWAEIVVFKLLKYFFTSSVRTGIYFKSSGLSFE